MGFKKFREKHFANLFTRFSLEYNELTSQERSILFEQLKQQKSQFPQMLVKDSLRIVELGPGSGPNLKYFPQNCHLTVVDPNNYFKCHFMKTLEQYPGISLDAYVSAYAKDLKKHIQDENVKVKGDAVVVTSVGCSVNDLQKYYKEIQRILVPGGKFYYLEHILAPRRSWVYFIQKLLGATKCWTFFTCNCHIDRKLDVEITKVGFSKIDQRLFEMPTPRLSLSFIAPLVTGIATK